MRPDQTYLRNGVPEQTCDFVRAGKSSITAEVEDDRLFYGGIPLFADFLFPDQTTVRATAFGLHGRSA